MTAPAIPDYLIHPNPVVEALLLAAWFRTQAGEPWCNLVAADILRAGNADAHPARIAALMRTIADDLDKAAEFERDPENSVRAHWVGQPWSGTFEQQAEWLAQVHRDDARVNAEQLARVTA